MVSVTERHERVGLVVCARDVATIGVVEVRRRGATARLGALRVVAEDAGPQCTPGGSIAALDRCATAPIEDAALLRVVQLTEARTQVGAAWATCNPTDAARTDRQQAVTPTEARPPGIRLGRPQS